ncbi:hypothetical protein HPB51_011331 [Rhipicephalus microplus]|uniref:Uncharacterized protein n=1 Tax=Rhipicephalus microplus TaxID=6941 RepID=A0A9J6E8P3_RHIMP|nr:hypothetical protein HPB51_011331 [Rhipicephalus microplus]
MEDVYLSTQSSNYGNGYNSKYRDYDYSKLDNAEHDSSDHSCGYLNDFNYKNHDYHCNDPGCTGYNNLDYTDHDGSKHDCAYHYDCSHDYYFHKKNNHDECNDNHHKNHQRNNHHDYSHINRDQYYHDRYYNYYYHDDNDYTEPSLGLQSPEHWVTTSSSGPYSGNLPLFFLLHRLSTSSSPHSSQNFVAICAKTKLIICTVSETATSEDMYPDAEYCDYVFYTNVITSNGHIQAEKDPVSWNVFQRRGPKYRRVQLGISFDFQNVTPNGLDDASSDLDALRREGMRHYGLLTVLSFQTNFRETVWSTKDVLEKMKEIQREETSKIVLAIGSYDFGAKLIICTVSETATSEDMYPDAEYCDYVFYTNVITSNGHIQAEKDPVSWNVFQRRGPKYRRVQLGISFDFQNVTPNGLDDASSDLDALRREGMRHYGLLTVLSFQTNFRETVWSTKDVLEVRVCGT